ncbi:MAG: tetratricopeptide repeat protein, partial [Myxococcota bacterium]
MHGRNGDVRDLLALLDGHSLVAVHGERGIGKSMLLETIASRYGVALHLAEAPKEIARGDLVVLDDADRLPRRALTRIARRVRQAHGRLLISVTVPRQAPRGAALHRLTTLSREAALAVVQTLDADRRAPGGLVERLAGHPWLLQRVLRLAAQYPGSSESELGSLLSDEVRKRWLSSLTRSGLTAAARLVEAGGCLPSRPGAGEEIDDGLASLVDEGLAELRGGFVVASALLLATTGERSSPRVLERLMTSLDQQARPPTGLAHLARAHLLLRLGRADDALSAQREAHRAHRGTARAEAYERGLLALLSAAPPRSLEASVRLALEVHRASTGKSSKEAFAAAKLLLDSGELEPEDALEARSFMAYLRIGLGRMERAAREMAAVARDAEAAGALYAQAQALLWLAWVRGLQGRQADSRELALQGTAVAKEARAPVLRERALYFLSRCEISEGRFDQARRHLEQALRLCKSHGLEDDQAVVLDALAELAGKMGRPSEAADHLDAADRLIAETGNLPRRAELAVTRAEVAMGRGHVTAARRILASCSSSLMDEGWRRDLLAAEIALASGDLEGARRGALEMGRPPTPSREWRRRRASLFAGLLEEGWELDLELDPILEDPVAAIVVERALGHHGSARRRADLLEEMDENDPDGRLTARTESLFQRMRAGEIDRAVDVIALLREDLVRRGTSTARLLLIEAVDHLLRAEPREAAIRAAHAHRSARHLGNERLACSCLEVLLSAQLAMGRLKAAAAVAGRATRMARRMRSPARAARVAALRVAISVRQGRGPEADDIEEARAGGDPIVRDLLDMLIEGSDRATAPDSGEPLARWLVQLLT